jgi:peptidoglycan/xylan/chitin deacetylase (PgdA/CDA1 family)
VTRAVLTFHSIDDGGSVVSFPIRSFQRLIERLMLSSVPVVSFQQLLHLEHGIAITFDDGMRSVHRHALPVLRANGVPAHLFLTTGAVDNRSLWTAGSQHFEMLTWDEVEECANHGVTIECHTATHPDLRLLPPDAVAAECRNADDAIERRLGRRPSLMAFPYGFHSPAVVQSIRGMYEACFTTRLAYLGEHMTHATVPRLDAYYLQPAFFRDRPLGVTSRSYLWMRSLIRAALRRQ